jgi:hypothetical protein
MIGIGEPLYHNDANSSPSANMSQSSEMQHLPFENGKVSLNKRNEWHRLTDRLFSAIRCGQDAVHLRFGQAKTHQFKRENDVQQRLSR